MRPDASIERTHPSVALALSFHFALLAGFAAIGLVIEKWADSQIRANLGAVLRATDERSTTAGSGFDH